MKKETIEEVIEQELENHFFSNISESKQAEYFIRFGINWQKERSFSEEEVEQMISSFEKLCYNYQSNKDWFPSKKIEWFKQFKKK